ncbi:MAG: FHA domain-containing protein [bacterium]
MGLDNSEQEITTLGDEAKARDLPEGMTVLLRVVEGTEPGKGYTIHKSPATIGRDAICNVSINDTKMSRQHAMLMYYPPGFYLKDLGSTNGTFYDDKRVKQAALKNGDRFRVGNTLLEFIVSSEPDAGGQG